MRYVFGMYGVLHIIIMVFFIAISIMFIKNHKRFIVDKIVSNELLKKYKKLMILDSSVFLVIYFLLSLILKEYSVLIHFRTLIYIAVLITLITNNKYTAIFSLISSSILLFEIFLPSSNISNYLLLLVILVGNIYSVFFSYIYLYELKLDIGKEEMAAVTIIFINTFAFIYLISATTASNFLGVCKPVGHLNHLMLIYNYDRMLYTFTYMLGYVGLLQLSYVIYLVITKKVYVNEFYKPSLL